MVSDVKTPSEQRGLDLKPDGFDPRLRRNVYVLSLTMGFMVLFFGWQSAYFSIYITLLGATTTQLGLFYAVSSLGHALSGIPFGRISDRRGRKSFVVAGTILTAFIYMSFAVMGTWVLLLIPMFVQQLFHAAYVNPMMAMLAESAPHDRRGTANGIFQGLAGALSFVAPVLAAVILLHYNDDLKVAMPVMFIITGGAILLGAAFRAKMLRETHRPILLPASVKLANAQSRVSLDLSKNDETYFENGGGLKSRVMLGFYSFIALSSFISSILYVFIPIYLYRTPVLGFGTTEIALWASVGAGVAMLAQIPTGRLADHQNKKQLLLIAIFLYALGISLFVSVVEVSHFLNITYFYGVIFAQIPLSVGQCLMANTQFAMLAGYTSSRNRSTGFSFQTAIFDLTAMPGPLIGGAIYEFMGSQVPFMLILLLTIPAFAVGLLFVRNPKLTNGRAK